MSLFKGSGVAIVTPFHEDGSFDLESLENLIEFHIEKGTDAIIVAGTTGEASTQTDEEQAELVKYTVDKVAGRLPVIAGAGSNDTRHGINLTKMCADAGADGLLQVTPYYNKTNQRGLYEHFKLCAEAVDIPTILYNVPGRTGMTIEPETVAALAEVKGVVGLKDATGNLSYTVKVKSLVPEEFDIYSGNDDVVIPVMSLGGSGVISVWANICPTEVHEMTHAYLNGELEKAWKLQVKYKELIDTLFLEANPIPVKAAMNMMGLNAGSLRMPMYEAEDSTKAKIKAAMERVGLL